MTDTSYEKQFTEAMDDDFNTPIAMSILFELSHEIQRLRDSDINHAAQHAALLKKLGSVLGILQDDPVRFLKAGTEHLDAEKIESLIASRNKARAEKNWAEADRIRDELAAMSVVLEDASGVTSWKFQG